jgi:hypothetical protein
MSGVSLYALGRRSVELKATITRTEIYRQMMRRGVPIWFYALEGREMGDGWDLVRCVMDTRGVIRPSLFRPHYEWSRLDDVKYFPNYFEAWAYRLRLQKGGSYGQQEPIE